MLKKITYKQFCEKFGFECGTNPVDAKKIALENGYKITDIHNIIDDCRRDGRL